MCRQLAAAGPQQHSRPVRAGAARRARLAPGAALAGVARRAQAADTGTGTTPAAKTSAAEAAHAGATTRLSLSPSDRNAGAASRRPGERGDCAALRCPLLGQNGAAGSVTERKSTCGAAIGCRTRDERDEQAAETMTIRMMARLTARAGSATALATVLRELCGPSRAEGGRLGYEGRGAQSEHDAREFMTLDPWTLPSISGSSPDGDARQRYSKH